MQANIDNTVDMDEFRFLLTGGIGTGEVPANPLPWLGDKLWAEMNRLSSFLGFVGFAEELQKNPVSHLFPCPSSLLLALQLCMTCLHHATFMLQPFCVCELWPVLAKHCIQL